MSDRLQPATTTHPQQPLHDARAIYDIANLHFEIVTESTGPWLVLKLLPSPHSGSATIIGAARDVHTGKLVDLATRAELRPELARSGMIKDGSWERIAALAGPAVAGSGKYSWTEPLVPFQKLENKDLYRPFAQGGCVLCRYSPATTGAAQFDAVHLLPPGWENDVKPAYDVFKQDRQLFNAPGSPAQVDRLKALLSQPNSVLASMAFRSLLENRKLDPGLVRTVLTQAQGYRLAVFVYLLLQLAPDLQLDRLIDEVDPVINSVTNLEGHKPVALAIATTRLLHPETRSSQSAAPPLMTTLRSRTSAPGAKQEADDYLRHLFEAAGVWDVSRPEKRT